MTTSNNDGTGIKINYSKQILSFRIPGITATMDKQKRYSSNKHESNGLTFKIDLLCNADNGNKPAGYVSIYFYVLKPIETVSVGLSFKIIPHTASVITREVKISIKSEYQVGASLGYGVADFALLADLLNPEKGLVHEGVLCIETYLTLRGLRPTACQIASQCTHEINERFSDGLFSDVTLTAGVKPVNNFKVHKLILSIHSPVFKAMFAGEMKESKSSTIAMQFPATGVKAMLAYMYNPYVSPQFLETNPAVELLHIANFYGVDSLVSICEHHMITILNVNNAMASLKTADKYNREKLKLAAMTFIVENTGTLMASADHIANLGETLWGEMLKFMTTHYQIVRKEIEKDTAETVLYW